MFEVLDSIPDISITPVNSTARYSLKIVRIKDYIGNYHVYYIVAFSHCVSLILT